MEEIEVKVYIIRSKDGKNPDWLLIRPPQDVLAVLDFHVSVLRLMLCIPEVLSPITKVVDEN